MAGERHSFVNHFPAVFLDDLTLSPGPPVGRPDLGLVLSYPPPPTMYVVEWSSGKVLRLNVSDYDPARYGRIEPCVLKLSAGYEAGE